VAEFDPAKFGRVIDSVQGTFGAQFADNYGERLLKAIQGQVGSSFDEMVQLVQLPDRLRARLEGVFQKGVLRVRETDDGIVIQIQANAVFDPRTLLLHPNGVELLTVLGRELARLPDPVRITGYAGRYSPLMGDMDTETNPWVRATFMAASVANFVTAHTQVAASRIHAFGMANHVPDTEQGPLGESQLEILVMRRTTRAAMLEIPAQQPSSL
jgi:flagellar motor protein MotB